MKPHLIKIHGLWYCADIYAALPSMGIGYTPAQAYSDWAYLHGVAA